MKKKIIDDEYTEKAPKKLKNNSYRFFNFHTRDNVRAIVCPPKSNLLERTFIHLPYAFNYSQLVCFWENFVMSFKVLLGIFHLPYESTPAIIIILVDFLCTQF